MSQPPRELLDAALTGVIDLPVLQRAAAAQSLSPSDMLDVLALHVARSYASQNLSFEEADKIMNAAYSLTVQEDFLGQNERRIPDLMYSVYEAFDAGEYHHAGDAADEDPERKYTQPLVADLLAHHRNDA